MKNTTKKYTFSAQERDKLQNIQIGIINAEATLDGLNIYKNILLQGVYKRLNLDPEKNKITYNLSQNEITTEEIAKDLLAKK